MTTRLLKFLHILIELCATCCLVCWLALIRANNIHARGHRPADEKRKKNLYLHVFGEHTRTHVEYNRLV